MTINPDQHELDPATGFHVDKETKQIIGLTQAPVRRLTDEEEWPKWVVVHPGHVVSREAEGSPVHISVPAFPEHFVNRSNGEITVLVHDADGEERALAAPRAHIEVKIEHEAKNEQT